MTQNPPILTGGPLQTGSAGAKQPPANPGLANARMVNSILVHAVSGPQTACPKHTPGQGPAGHKWKATPLGFWCQQCGCYEAASEVSWAKVVSFCRTIMMRPSLLDANGHLAGPVVQHFASQLKPTQEEWTTVKDETSDLSRRFGHIEDDIEELFGYDQRLERLEDAILTLQSAFNLFMSRLSALEANLGIATDKRNVAGTSLSEGRVRRGDRNVVPSRYDALPACKQEEQMGDVPMEC